MTEPEEVVRTSLATRIPKALHRELRVYCVHAGISVMDFVTKAIEEKLGQSRGSPPKAPTRRRKRPAG
jgi:predicted HicB family RNase H-like nuclease